jgi:hypothetical protein
LPYVSAEAARGLGAEAKIMDVKQFREFIVRPTLEYIGLYSKSAENLVVGTAIQESGGLRFIDQLTPGPGPAYGLYQCERATHDDIWSRFLAKRPDLSDKVDDLLSLWPTRVEQLRTNIHYATAMCRIHYLRFPDPLPEADDIEGLGRLWKRRYNSMLGKGTVEQFVANYRKYAQ